jgi:hypothetical protein
MLLAAPYCYQPLAFLLNRVIVVGIVRKVLHLFYFDHYYIVIINFASQWMFVMNVYDNVNSSCIKQAE